MKYKVEISFGKQITEPAVIEYKNDFLIIYRKPKWAKYVFGFLGKIIAPFSKKSVIDMSTVILARTTSQWKDREVLELVLSKNKNIKIYFTKNNDLCRTLKNRIYVYKY